MAGRHLVCSSCGRCATARAGGAGRPEAEGRGPAVGCRNCWCAAPDRPLAAVFPIGCYTGGLRRAIVAYKYGADLRWARPFGGALHTFLVRFASWFEELDVVCPVPSFVGAGARRPWGHVELVCAELERLAGGEWPVEQLVTKTAETEPMSAKDRPARRRIAERLLGEVLLVPDPSSVEGRRVLVVDDVCVSGATLLAVSRALRQAGAEEVCALVLARASWRRPEP